ncbi:MAG TPA: endolytic transglycosylase MltG [Bacteroidota bacterium]|nr:endolytic transglycosylase MltG [Bacteroidota bacterium]
MKRLDIILGSLVGLGCILLYLILWSPNTFDGDRIVIVSKGESFTRVEDSLAAKGVLSNRLLFNLAGRLLGNTTRIQIGKYRFKSGMSNKEILLDLRVGKTVEMITVAIPEGLDIRRQAHILRRTLGIDSARYVQLARDSAFASQLGSSSGSLEGYLYPDTYKFYWQTDEQDILKTFTGEFWKFWTDTLAARASEQKMPINNVLALASIIEWETKIDTERAMISEVYLNRLKKGMRLQADPTVQYLLPEGHRLLHYSDLHIESPYNTYLYKGLPPGPVNSPGKASILAALYPKKNSYLYFVANGTGGHTFTRRFQDHERAVRNYRKFREREEEAKEDSLHKK